MLEIPVNQAHLVGLPICAQAPSIVRDFVCEPFTIHRFAKGDYLSLVEMHDIPYPDLQIAPEEFQPTFTFIGYAVLILGGGLVGLTLAIALDRHGLASIVVDPADPQTQLTSQYDGRATAVTRSAAARPRCRRDRRVWRCRG